MPRERIVESLDIAEYSKTRLILRFEPIPVNKLGRLSLVLAESVLLEAATVIAKKMPDREQDFRCFLNSFRYKTVPLPSKKMVDRHRRYVIHDEDAPALASAVLADADYVVTGDKQFANTAVGQMVELISCSELLPSLSPKLA